jgi:hypothetical protein
VSSAVQPYLFHQIGLDSGSLTMLGTIVHRFAEPGEYRGVSLRTDKHDAVFYLTVEKGLATNQVNIDLATLQQSSPTSCGCAAGTGSEGRFVLGANGYAVFHVSGGPGGFAVHVGPAADSPPEHREFDSVKLQNGDLFAATILRPGIYTASNLAQPKSAPVELNVAYPRSEKKPFQPPAAIRVKATARGFHPEGRVELFAMQGCIFVCEAPSRIKIELKQPHDPPPRKR